MSDDLSTIGDVLVADPLNGWDSKRTQRVIKECESDWLLSLANWQTMVTLTFREPRPEDACYQYFRRLVQVLNKDAFGKRYIRKVGHSYFCYALALEYQKRNVPHFHFVADKPINFDLVHTYWNHVAGFAWCEPIREAGQAVSYCSKYLAKGGRVDLYWNVKTRTPMIGNSPPYWWK